MRFLKLAIASCFTLCLVPGFSRADSASRHVSFGVREVTAPNLDVSADGRFLAISILGDIYRVPVGGGRAEPITSGPGWDFSPRWSPDGLWVAFISDVSGTEQAYVVRNGLNGPKSRITFIADETGTERVTRELRWLPDSRAIVVNGMSYQLRDPEATNYGEPEEATRSNSSKAVTTRKADDGECLVLSRSNDGQERLLATLDSSAVCREILVSNDERWIAYRTTQPDADTIGTSEVLLVASISQAETNVAGIGPTGPLVLDIREQLDATIGHIVFSPDSRFIYGSFDGKLWKLDLATKNMQEIPFEAGVRQVWRKQVYNKYRLADRAQTIRSVQSPAWSPDGETVAFSAMRKLFVMRGNAATEITAQELGQFQPAFSPDGRSIAYVTWSDVDGGALWRLNLPAGQPIRVSTSKGNYQNPVWSSDGSRIAVTVSPFSGAGNIGAPNLEGHAALLRVYDLSGHYHVDLTAKAYQGFPIMFSHDGSRLYYTAHAEHMHPTAVRSIALARATDDKIVVKPREIPAKDHVAEWVSLSPDASQVAVIGRGNLYLTSLSGDGVEGESIQLTCNGAAYAGWSPDGRYLRWSMANHLYSLDVDAMTEKFGSHRPTNGQCVEHLLPNAFSTGEIVIPMKAQVNLGTYALSGARVLTMEDDRVIEDGMIVVRDGRILAIGKQSLVDIPSDATMIDVSGKTIIPGLVDMHAHPRDAPKDLLAANWWGYLVNLAFGITTIRELSNAGDHGFAYRDQIDAGITLGPRIISTPALFPAMRRVDSSQDARDTVARLAMYGAETIKIHDGYTRVQRQWLIESARALGLNVAAHQGTRNYLSPDSDLTAIVDGVTTLEHPISYETTLERDFLEAMGQSGVWWNPTPIADSGTYPRDCWPELVDDPRISTFFKDIPPAALSPPANGSCGRLRGHSLQLSRDLATFASLGGRWTIGSHGMSYGIGMHWEMWAIQEGGMSAADTLRAATIGGAEALGMQDDIGSLAVGKLADMVVLNGNPLTDIRNTVRADLVVKGGVIYRANDLHALYPKKPLRSWDGTLH